MGNSILWRNNLGLKTLQKADFFNAVALFEESLWASVDKNGPLSLGSRTLKETLGSICFQQWIPTGLSKLTSEERDRPPLLLRSLHCDLLTEAVVTERAFYVHGLGKTNLFVEEETRQKAKQEGKVPFKFCTKKHGPKVIWSLGSLALWRRHLGHSYPGKSQNLIFFQLISSIFLNCADPFCFPLWELNNSLAVTAVLTQPWRLFAQADLAFTVFTELHLPWHS